MSNNVSVDAAKAGSKNQGAGKKIGSNQSKTAKPQTEMSMFATQLLMQRGINDRLKITQKLAVISGAVNVILAITVVALLMTSNVEYKFFTVDPQGRVTPVIPVDRPILSEGALRDWAGDCVRSSYTFMFTDYKDALGKSLSRCFTSDGAVAFKEQLARSGIVKQVVGGQGALITQVDGIVNIKKEGEVDGRKAYQIEIPVKVSKVFPKESPQVRDWTVIITAFRVDNLEYEKGMAIHVWGMEPRR